MPPETNEPRNCRPHPVFRGFFVCRACRRAATAGSTPREAAGRGARPAGRRPGPAGRRERTAERAALNPYRNFSQTFCLSRWRSSLSYHPSEVVG